MDNKQRDVKPKILITEDDLENQKFLQLILRRNFEVDVCDSETTFFQKLSDAKTDCEQRKMNFIGMGINEKGNFESQCYTKSPLKFYKFEIEVLE